MRKRLRIGVVGAGVAGSVAAVLLARDGHSVDLLEQTPRVGPVGAGLLLQPTGQRVLREMGLLEAVEAKAARIDALVAHTHHGRLLSRLTYADHTAGMHALGVHRADLFSVLHAALGATDVRLRLGQAIDGTRQTACGRRLSCRGADAGEYDLVVVADGSRSSLRAVSGLRAFVHAYRPAAMWAVGACAWPQGELVQYARSNAELCGLLPTGGGRCSFFWAVDDSAPHRLRRSPFDDWRRQVVALAPAARQLVESLHGWGDLMFASYRAVFMPRVVTDRLVVIGDAAHAAGPHLGQGANLALLDATALRDATRAAPGLPAALHAYNATQWWRNAYYGLATAALMPTFQGRFPGIGWARDFALPLMQRARPMRQLMLRTLCGVW